MSNRAGILIQARSNSSRLPGKIYAGLPAPGARSILENIYRRMEKVQGVDVVAVLAPEGDQMLLDFCNSRGLRYSVGSELDVRERYRQAVRELELDFVVRATGDNPCVDVKVAEQSVEEIRRRNSDLVSYYNLPLGVAVEVFGAPALCSDEIETEPEHREHVSLHIKHNPAHFEVTRLKHSLPEKYAGLTPPRLTVDTAEDLAVIRAVYRELGDDFDLKDIMELSRRRPGMFTGNSHVEQRAFNPLRTA